MYYPNQEGIICSADHNGSNETVFRDASVSGGINVAENDIFIDRDTQTIRRMDKDGGDETELNYDRSDSLNIVSDWIFYEN